ncbi:GNAT family N-acetyltransferase [Sungkyunkwania multivorans]|uniref:GNAT family N-acetyltransferase n=1 Tax=Sungkyunkwania multivorans TaxID=1173618 RepID=A0ABW3CWX2_9FLAO
MTTLENDIVLLKPLTPEHFDVLLPISKQLDVYRYSPSDISTDKKLKVYLQAAIDLRSEGRAIPFLVHDKRTSEVAGCTRFGHIDHKNKVIHIGWTWIAPKFQGTGLNTNMKFLMLYYAFEELMMEKVEFRIDERNTRSRKAVEKLGAKLEGVLRKSVVVKDGFRRNTCCYGMLREEWPRIKQKLMYQIA